MLIIVEQLTKVRLEQKFLHFSLDHMIKQAHITIKKVLNRIKSDGMEVEKCY